MREQVRQLDMALEDRLADPLRTLAVVQLAMGALALATLPLYVRSFAWTASLLATFAPTDAGYAGFTIARYTICLIIMLPATFCAGMTFPTRIVPLCPAIQR